MYTLHKLSDKVEVVGLWMDRCRTMSRMASSALGTDWTMVGGGASGDTENSSVHAFVRGLNST